MEMSEFRFRNPSVTHVECIVNDDFISKGKIEFPCSLSSEVKKSETEDIANVELTVTVGGKAEAFPFFISITVESDFNWSASAFSGDAIDNLLNKNAPALLLGYARPIVALITGASRYPAFNIPFFDFTKDPIDQ